MTGRIRTALIMVGLVSILVGCSSTPGGATPVPAGSSAMPAPTSVAASGTAGSSIPADFPVGAWTTTITEEDLRQAGVSQAGELSENQGTFTMTLGPDGVWTTSQETGAPIRWPVFRGTYEVTGPTTFRQRTDFPSDFAGDVVDFVWRVEDGRLLLTVPDPPDHLLPIVMESHPWEPAA